MTELKLEDLEKRIKSLEEKNSQTVKLKKDKVKREPSEYNKFMKSELKKVKEEDSELTHKEAWSICTKNWSLKKEQKESK